MLFSSLSLSLPTLPLLSSLCSILSLCLLSLLNFWIVCCVSLSLSLSRKKRSKKRVSVAKELLLCEQREGEEKVSITGFLDPSDAMRFLSVCMCVRECVVLCVCVLGSLLLMLKISIHLLFSSECLLFESHVLASSRQVLLFPPFLVAYLPPRPLLSLSPPSLPPASMCPQSQCEPEPKVDEAAVKRLPENK